jgi:hypothetical protein
MYSYCATLNWCGSNFWCDFLSYHITSNNDPVVTLFYKRNFLCKFISICCIVTNSITWNVKPVFTKDNFHLSLVLASFRVNLYVETAERINVCGENDACNFSYRCVFFLQPLVNISQPKALCTGAVYYADIIVIVRVNRIVSYWRRTYGSGREGKRNWSWVLTWAVMGLPNIAVV